MQIPFAQGFLLKFISLLVFIGPSVINPISIIIGFVLGVFVSALVCIVVWRRTKYRSDNLCLVSRLSLFAFVIELV